MSYASSGPPSVSVGRKSTSSQAPVHTLPDQNATAITQSALKSRVSSVSMFPFFISLSFPGVFVIIVLFVSCTTFLRPEELMILAYFRVETNPKEV